jgi:hypothetical protein
LALDPFFLQTNTGSQAINTSSVTQPARDSLSTVPISTTNGVQGEGIDFFETQNASGQNIIDRSVLTGISGSAPLNVTTTTGLENAGTDTVFNIEGSRRTDNTSTSPATLSTYLLAWDRYTTSSSNFSLRFQIFNANGTVSSSVIQPVITPSRATSVTVATTAMPAWQFRSGSGEYVLGISETNSATNPSLNLTGPHQALQFQRYNVNGAADSVKFTIQPDLDAYAAGATNQIIQAKTGSAVYPSRQFHFTQLSGANSGAYVIAWNELVTDSTGTHDQVEFVVFRTGSGAGTGVVYRQTFQIAAGNVQNVQVSNYVDPNGNEYAVLAYGDSSATNVYEFRAKTTLNSSNVPITSVTPVASVTNPVPTAYTPTVLGSVDALGDGRISISYNTVIDSSETSQFLVKTFDFRTTGLNIDDSGLSGGQDKYIAGTQFNNVFKGENGVNNNYYFVGSAVSGAAADVFDGGTSTSTAASWNTAIFPDARANYSIQTTNGTTTISNTGDPQHAGSLTVDSNVQALEFAPTRDPEPTSAGLEVSGDRLVLLQAYGGAVTVDPGATLELANPNSFTGTVSGLISGNFIDFDGFDPNTIQPPSFSGTSTGGTLTVADATHSVSIALLGNYLASIWVTASDGHGGTIIHDPPIAAGQSDSPADEPATSSALSSSDTQPTGPSSAAEIGNAAGVTVIGDQPASAAASSNVADTSASSGGSKGVAVPDIAFRDIDLGQAATVANWLPTHDTGGSLGARTSPHDLALAMLGHYMASSFATASEGYGAKPFADPPPDQQQHLSLPHVG